MALMDGMPNIPDFKGLVSSGTDAAISLGGAALINLVFGNYWGIFNQYGIPILLADNVLSVKYGTTGTVANAPIEKGSFASYNKVEDPYKATVEMSKGSGGSFQRGAFLAQLEMLKNSTLKFYVITPEYVYKDACIVGLDYARSSSDGAQLIKVNVHLEEVREVVVEYSSEEVKNPDDAAKKNGGDKQAQSAADKGESMMRKAYNWVKGMVS